MGWEKGRYYTRSKKVNGRVIREYVGGGQLGQLGAQLDALQREEQQQKARAWHQQTTEMAELAAQVEAIIQATDLAVHAALVAAGYRQHKRGEWRKRRGQRHDRQ